MKATGVKLICERADGEITTWHTPLERTIEDVIEYVRYNKRWLGGKFLEIYIEFDNNGEYYKTQLDTRRFNHLLEI